VCPAHSTPLFHRRGSNKIKAGKEWIASKPLLLFPCLATVRPRDVSKPSFGVRYSLRLQGRVLCAVCKMQHNCFSIQGVYFGMGSITLGTLRNTLLKTSWARSTDSSMAMLVGLTRTLTCLSRATRSPAITQALR
jgi:hypothetical protein